MSVITTGAHPKALWPGVHAFTMAEYNNHPKEYTHIFDVENSKMAYEEDVETTGFGLAQRKAEGAATIYDSQTQGFTQRYTHVAYSLGYMVTKEEKDDNLYKDRAFRRSRQLAFSFRTTKEIVGANVLNRGFNGVSLLSDSHPTLSGVQSNTAGPAADLSEAAVEGLLIQINQAKNSRGLPIAIKGLKLIVPPALLFDAQRIVNSNLKSGTDQNDINVLRGVFPDGICTNHYLTDPSAWFIKTDVPNGLTCFERKKFEFTKDNDFDTDTAKAKGYERYSMGWTDWRSLYGSPGAS